MEQLPTSPDVTTVGTTPTTVRPICGFWIRLLAFLIDLVILRILGIVLGLVFGSLFLMMGNFARLIGLAIVLAYFGILQSHEGGGQSLGQRVTRIRVVGPDGECISTGRSLCRTAILWLPALLNQPVIPVRALMSPAGILLGAVWGVSAGGLVYFYLFNRTTRQSIHDLVCRTYVVKSSAEGPLSVGRVSRTHYVVFPSIMVLLGVLGAVLALTMASGPLKTVFALVDRIGSVKGGTVVGVNENYWFSSDGSRLHTIQVVIVPSLDAEPQELAKKVGMAVERECGDTTDIDRIAVDVLFTYNILIQHASTHYVWYASPKDWRAGASGTPEVREEMNLF